jgi:Cdc6-like AAA superfamily ATPase
MGLASAVSLWILAGLLVVAGSSLVLDRAMWRPLWRGLSSLLDPLRAIHWASVPVLVLCGLGLFGLYARAVQSLPVTVLWVVLAGLSVVWFCRGRYQAYRYRKAVGEGLAIDLNITETSESISLLDRWAGSVGLPKRSILVAGASGSGKTEAAKHLVQQLLFDRNSLVLVYDHKSDFQEFFDTLGIEYITISMSESSTRWNLFRELEDSQDVDEFARALFPELSGGDNDFFDDTARQVFAACLKMLLFHMDQADLSNATVRTYFQRRGVAEVYEDLNAYPQFRAAASAIDVEASPKQAQGVYASVQRVVNKVFVGDFGKAPEEGAGFAIREHINNPQGVPVVLDFPQAAGQSTKPIFRFLIDHAAMFALEDTETYSYFVLDEFAQIPHLRRLGELVNVGRGEQVVTLVTLQSVQQLRQNYGREGGEAILSGLVSMILLRPNDPETVEFYRSAIGTDFTEYTQHVEADTWEGERRETKDVEEHPFSTGEIRRWDPGVGVIVTQDGWLHGYISLLSERTREFVENILGSPESADADAIESSPASKAIEEGPATEPQAEQSD